MKTVSFAALIAICACGALRANPILMAPSGSTLGTGQVRAEAAVGVEEENGNYFWLGAGLAQFEAHVLRLSDVKGRTEDRIGAQWNFLPETFATPGVAFGVTDAASESEEGIGGYVVVTKRLKTARLLPVLSEISGTVGVGGGGINGLFGGVEARFSGGFFVQAEYDGDDFNGAVGWQPVKMFRIKGYRIKDEFYVGAEVRPFSF